MICPLPREPILYHISLKHSTPASTPAPCSLNLPSTLLPQDICTCYSLCLQCSFPRYLGSQVPHLRQFTCYLLRGTFPDLPVENGNPPPTPPPPLITYPLLFLPSLSNFIFTYLFVYLLSISIQEKVSSLTQKTPPTVLSPTLDGVVSELVWSKSCRGEEEP